MDKERVQEISCLIHSDSIPFDKSTEEVLLKRALEVGIDADEAAEFAHEATWEKYLREYQKN